jgi:hypothetical protein
VKIFGMKSLGDTLGAIGCKLVLIEDTAQTAKILARMTPRERPIRHAAPAKSEVLIPVRTPAAW